jgi:hypothetical protein
MLKKENLDKMEMSRKLMEQFMQRPVTIKPIIPVGSHRAVFNGFVTKTFRETVGFEIKLHINGIDYSYDMPFSASPGEKAEKQLKIYESIIKDIGRQFGLYGDVYIDTLNEYVGKEIDLHVVVKDGRRYTNFYKAKEVEPETEIVQF